MSDWEEKLNTLLSDPDAMAQVMSMAQSLSGQLGGQSGNTPPADEAESAQAQGGGAQTAEMPDLSSLLGGLDAAALQKLLPLLGQMNRPESGETAALLRALRPFLKPERQEKVERAAQLARFIHLGKVFLLQEGNGHV